MKLPNVCELKPYPGMKDSGIEWLGKVPEHWKVLPGRACFREKKQPNLALQEKTVLSLSYGQIVVKPPEKLHGLVPSSFETYQIINPLDIVIRPTDLQNDWNSLRFGLSRHRGIITSAYLCFRTINTVTPEYGHLLLHSYDLMKVFYGLGSGLRQNLDWSDFKHLPCSIPPLPEQTAIVRFLDHADRHIRRYIRAKQKLIALLEEQKQAIIHQAVTGQIDVRTGQPYPSYKASGVEWLGKVPSHWEVRRARYIFREIDRRSPDGSEQHLSMSQSLGLVPSHFVENRTLVSENYAGGKLCRSGDLVLNRLKAHLGVFARAQQSGIISTDYTVLRPNREAKTEYFEQVLRSPSCRGELRTRAKGIVEGFWRLYTDDLYDIYLPLPTVDEQESIIRWIKSISIQAERNAALGDREVALLHEYRTRLIADVVTGKLDVREAAAELPEEDISGNAEESAEEYTIEKELTV